MIVRWNIGRIYRWLELKDEVKVVVSFSASLSVPHGTARQTKLSAVLRAQ